MRRWFTVALFCLFALTAIPAQVTLEWDHSLDRTVTGYRIYGRTGEVYTLSWPSAGYTNRLTITNLLHAVRYVFTAVATNDVGVESLTSNEAGFTSGAPSTPRGLLIEL